MSRPGLDPIGAAPTADRPAEPAEARPRGFWRSWSGLTAFVVVGLVVIVLLAIFSLSLGAGTWADVWRALTSGDADTTAVLVRRRLPRAVLAILVGAALGVAGVLMQAVTRNPLADPGILGINAGAYAAVVLGVALLGTTSASSLVWVALAGALVASLLVFAIGTTGRGADGPGKLVLAGVALAAVFAGFSFTISLLNSETFDKIRFWQVGSLQGRDWDVVASVSWFIVIGLVAAMLLASSLNALALGDDLATTLGTKVGRIRAMSLMSITLLCGAATAAIGPITFLGLMVPHAVRAVVGPDLRKVLPVSLIVGPALLLAADVVGRLISSPEVPVGVVMAGIGAPVLIALTRRKRGRAS